MLNALELNRQETFSQVRKLNKMLLVKVKPAGLYLKVKPKYNGKEKTV